MPSSVIKAFRYDEPARLLLIEFVSGETYCYSDVPQSIASGFADAFSKGRYFARHIRDKFNYQRQSRSGALRSGVS
jgi:hypothetical protein